MRNPLILLVAAVSALFMSGCDPDEQGRPLSFAGSYAGVQKPPLSPELLRELAVRTEYQRGPVSAQDRAPALRSASGALSLGRGASVRVGDGS